MKIFMGVLVSGIIAASLVFANSDDEIASLSGQGKVKEAIAEYHDYFLQSQQHNPQLLENILGGFLRNTDSKYGYATRRDISEVMFYEVMGGEKNKDEIVKCLRENLSFPDTGVKVNAAKFLILLGYKGEDLFPVLKEGLNGSNAAVSLDAALFLGFLNSEKAIPLLKKGMKSSNPIVAAASIMGLGKTGGAKATALLINGLKGRITSSINTSGQIRLASAKALGKIGGRDAIVALGKTLKSRDKKLKKEVVNALGKIALQKRKKAEGTGFKRLFKKEITPLSYIESAFNDETVKEDAAKILLNLGEKSGADFFKEKLAGGNIEEKLEAASLLAKAGDRNGIGVVESVFKSNDKKMRKKAVKSLKDFGDDALPLIRKASNDPDPAIRIEVINVARKLGRGGEETIIVLAGDSNPDVKKKALFALIGFGLTGDTALDFLLEEGSFGMKIRRRDFAKLLVSEDTGEIISRIEGIINSQDKYSKVELAEILLYLGEKAVSVPVLVDALAWSKAPRYQKKAAYALASIKDKTSLPFLEERFFNYGYAEVETVKALLDLMQ